MMRVYIKKLLRKKHFHCLKQLEISEAIGVRATGA